MKLPLFVIPLFVGLLIQITKIFIDLYQEKKFTWNNFFRAWWFPSVHSWISSSLITIMWIKFGIYSTEFAISTIFAFLFWYDAMNIRYEAWKHAKFINQINFDLKNVLDNWTWPNTFYLKERLGHTFEEVIWWIIIGSIITFLLYYFSII